MVIASVKTEKSKQLSSFIEKTKDRLKYQMFLTEARILCFDYKKETYVLCSMKNKFTFPLFELGLLGVLAILLTVGIHWIILIPMIPFCAGLFEKPFFISFLLKRGLKKEKHTNNINIVSPEELNEVLLNYGKL